MLRPDKFSAREEALTIVRSHPRMLAIRIALGETTPDAEDYRPEHARTPEEE